MAKDKIIGLDRTSHRWCEVNNNACRSPHRHRLHLRFNSRLIPGDYWRCIWWI